MDGSRLERVLARIEAAAARIEQAAARPAPAMEADPALARSHEALRESVAGAIAELDTLIERLEA